VTGRILLIDDEALFREDLASLLRQEGYVCQTAADGETGLRLAEAEEFDVVLCDLVMPGISGIEIVERLSTCCPGTAVLLVTAYGSLETAVEAFRKGVADYLLKPVVSEDVLAKIRRCLTHRRLQDEVRYLRHQLREVRTGSQLIGVSTAMVELRELTAKFAPTDSTVLLTGESGTGKELVARMLHESSKSAEGPFMAINCAALPHELTESELFGHVRGAFTGAVSDKLGLFELAGGGTLLLDEVAELPLSLQAKLLRAIERREFFRLGGVTPVTYSARIVSATNRRLEEEVKAGRFRGDLYYRLKVVEIHLPPLRERQEDIPLLADHILRRLNPRLKRRILGVEPVAMRILMALPWRGNVRELENVLERAMILAEGDSIEVSHLPRELTGDLERPEFSRDLRTAVRAFELEHIGRVLAETEGNREEAARRLGIDPSTLYRRLKEPNP
jgi:two-component system response regulator PilR (NtrC family)